MEAKFAKNPELSDNIRLSVKPSHHYLKEDLHNPELIDGIGNYKELKKQKSKEYDASKYNDYHELQADFRELRSKSKRKDSKMMAKGRRKKKKPKLNFEGEKFKDPDPYQLAVRKTQYSKDNGKFKFEGEKFKDPDPFGLAIRKQSSIDETGNGKDVLLDFRNQLHHAHPGLVHGSTEYYNKDCYIADLHEDAGDDDDDSSGSSDSYFNRAALSQFLAVGVKNVLLLGYGMTLGFPTIVIPAVQGGDGRGPSLEKDFFLNKDEISWLSSINLICVPLGCIFSGMLTQPIGRRRAMQIVTIPMLIAWLLFHFATDVHFLYCGLALAGFAGGLSEAPVLTYVAEITQPVYRGMLAATGSTCVILGVLIQFLMGSFLRWRTVALCSACVPVIAFLLLFLVPESPVWLIGKGRHRQARQSLAWLRGWVQEDQIESEFYELQKHMQIIAEREKESDFSSGLKRYTSRTFLQPFGIISLCFFVGHFSGMTTLQTYAVQIFHTLKAPIDKYYATTLLGVAELLGTLFCVGLVHFSGKRPLVFISTIGCAVCIFAVASYSQFLNAIPGTTVSNVVANVSAIKAEIQVLPLNHSDRVMQIPTMLANASLQFNATSANSSEEIGLDDPNAPQYDDQSFTPYFLNGSYDDTLNTSIIYGEYVKSAIPRDVFVQIPHSDQNKYLWLPLTLLLGSAFLTHMGIRLIPWMLIGELYNPTIRSGASGISGGVGYIFGFLANKLFLKMLATFTLPGTYYIYSAITIIGAIILYKTLPETEGKSLIDIEQYFVSERKKSIHFELESAEPPKPKPRGYATAFAPPPPLPPRSHPLKDDIGRIRKISQQFGRRESASSPSRKVSEASMKSNGDNRKISTTSSKGSVHNFTLNSSRPSQSSNEYYRKISASKMPPPLPPIHGSPDRTRKIHSPQSKTITITKPPNEVSQNPSEPQNYRKISDSHKTTATNSNIPVLKVAPHRETPPQPTVQSRKPKPQSMEKFDVNTWDSNLKFEELLRKRDRPHHSTRSTAVNSSGGSQHDLKRDEDAHLLAVGRSRHRQNSGSLNLLTEIGGGGLDNRAYAHSRVDLHETQM
ncbi:uncharacterized protein LOC129756270 isoform X2 [Uranotaenia lowii]|uniref:uncharacterized protein LOC129756270 isoform X2 n=1 Tax=Uranotaenia lowii TaxID=190385 RepID=UPI0024795E35|nr:uncharacterized protein LOC129756270 isoform X2 [Uranotaenia lowii]